MWKILVVDDNAANRELLVETFRDTASCDVAVNGREAMDVYRQNVSDGRMYDIILLDLAMPEVDGIEFLKFVRAIESEAGVVPGEGVPVIIVTAFVGSFMKAFNGGCDDYVLKPVDPLALLQKVRLKLSR
jgi:two-component system chemotaxis response regulator CheY